MLLKLLDKAASAISAMFMTQMPRNISHRTVCPGKCVHTCGFCRCFPQKCTITRRTIPPTENMIGGNRDMISRKHSFSRLTENSKEDELSPFGHNMVAEFTKV